jgi:hypothetical protein
MTQTDLDFSVPVHRLIRKGAADTSIEAALNANLKTTQERVYNAIKSFGDDGCISDEVLDYLKPMPYGSITSHYGFLIEKGYVELTGDKRPGKSGRNQRVMRARI